MKLLSHFIKVRNVVRKKTAPTKNLFTFFAVSHTHYAYKFVTAHQWQRSSRSVGYSAMEANSIEAAEKLLDEVEKVQIKSSN